jgi:hypothetical protein
LHSHAEVLFSLELEQRGSRSLLLLLLLAAVFVIRIGLARHFPAVRGGNASSSRGSKGKRRAGGDEDEDVLDALEGFRSWSSEGPVRFCFFFFLPPSSSSESALPDIFLQTRKSKQNSGGFPCFLVS